MGSHPINLAIRFLLEVTVLIAAGYWGWKQSDGWPRFLLAFGIPILLGSLWTTFAVPDDPSRSGNAPIVTPGFIRLLLELAIFSFGAWVFYDMGKVNYSLAYGIIVLVHYAVSYDRIIWLLGR